MSDTKLPLGLLRCTAVKSMPKYSHTSTWTEKVWNGLDSFGGEDIWTDGTNIYYSTKVYQYVLNGDTWEPKIWNSDEAFKFFGSHVWTDGTNIYYSYCYEHYVLNGNTWIEKVWNGNSFFYGTDVWSDGENIYSKEDGGMHVVLNGDTWEAKTWNGLTDFLGRDVWSDGENIYAQAGEQETTLNGDTWEAKTWNIDPLYGGKETIWSCGTSIYISVTSVYQYVLNGNTWEEKTWNGFTNVYGENVWSDGKHIYFSEDEDQYVLAPVSPVQLNPAALMQGFFGMQGVRRSRK